MVTIGVDAHKRIHVALALDDAGREIGEWQGRNSVAGWRDVSQWASGFEGGGSGESRAPGDTDEASRST